MALDATPSGSSSNSFVTVAEGDAFAAETLGAAAWTAATTANKEASLISATRRINQLCMTGTATTSTQSLAVPRTGWTQYGQAVAATVVPAALKYATFLLALLYLQTDGSAALTPDAVTEGLSKLKAGSVELQWRSDFTFTEVPPHVLSQLPSEWLCDDDQVYVEFEVL